MRLYAYSGDSTKGFTLDWVEVEVIDGDRVRAPVKVDMYREGVPGRNIMPRSVLRDYGWTDTPEQARERFVEKLQEEVMMQRALLNDALRELAAFLSSTKPEGGGIASDTEKSTC